MCVLLVNIKNDAVEFEGKTKAECLADLDLFLESLNDQDLSGAEIEPEIWKFRYRILSLEWMKSSEKHIPLILNDSFPWGIETEEDGQLMVAWYTSRRQAIWEFMDIAREDGEHWI